MYYVTYYATAWYEALIITETIMYNTDLSALFCGSKLVGKCEVWAQASLLKHKINPSQCNFQQIQLYVVTEFSVCTFTTEMYESQLQGFDEGNF